jgi:hypothetical protein
MQEALALAYICVVSVAGRWDSRSSLKPKICKLWFPQPARPECQQGKKRFENFRELSYIEAEQHTNT